MKFAILIPTPEEAAPFIRMMSEEMPAYEYEVFLCGIGSAAAAGSAAKAAAALRPDAVMLGGIAGAYTGSGLRTGQCVSVVAEHTADLGSIRSGTFVSLHQPASLRGPRVAGNSADNTYSLNNIPGVPFREVVSNTVNCCATPWLDWNSRPAASVENMEGAGAAAVCSALGIPLYELRAVSNTVGDPPAAWRGGEAASRLAEAMKKTLEILACDSTRRPG